MATFSYSLPYPPSMNHYWRRVGNKTLISREGRAYRETVCAQLAHERFAPDGRLMVLIDVTVPDRRRRDLDNLLKPLLDAMQHADVFKDDEAIDDLQIRRQQVKKPGRVVVTVTELTT